MTNKNKQNDKKEENIIEEECMYCGNTGRTKEDPYKCKHCGREYRTENAEVTKDLLDEIYIPKAVLDNPWSREKAREMIKAKTQTGSATRTNGYKWVDNLNMFLDMVKTKPLRDLPRTVYVTAAPNNGVRNWAFKILLAGESNGYDVDGIKDLNDIDLNDPVDLDLVSNKEIVVFRLVNYNLDECLEKLNYIIPKREDRDYTTIIISNLPYDYVMHRPRVMYTFPRPSLIDGPGY